MPVFPPSRPDRVLAPSASSGTTVAAPEQERLSLAQWAWIAALTLLLLDSLISYFLSTFTGKNLPINALVALVAFSATVIFGLYRIIPPPLALVNLFLLFLGLSIGIITIDKLPLTMFVGLFGVLIAFSIGYAAIRWNSNAEIFRLVFVGVGALYAVICTVALLKIHPSLFPLEYTNWGYEGRLYERPQVTTDQNTQVFYLLMIPLVFSLANRAWIIAASSASLMCSFYILSQLQTRSGILVLGALTVFSLASPLWYKELGRKKLLLLPLFILVPVAALVGGFLDDQLDAILLRFSNTEETGGGRLLALEYLFSRIGNTVFWLPQGEVDWRRIHFGGSPHSMPTVMFLYGGLPALVGWAGLFVLPTIALGWRFLTKKLDRLEIMILVAGMGSLVLSLSLPHPFNDQAWLWTGAAVGALERSRRREIAAARERVPLLPRQPLVKAEAAVPETAKGGRARPGREPWRRSTGAAGMTGVAK